MSCWLLKLVHTTSCTVVLLNRGTGGEGGEEVRRVEGQGKGGVARAGAGEVLDTSRLRLGAQRTYQ